MRTQVTDDDGVVENVGREIASEISENPVDRSTAEPERIMVPSGKVLTTITMKQTLRECVST